MTPNRGRQAAIATAAAACVSWMVACGPRPTDEGTTAELVIEWEVRSFERTEGECPDPGPGPCGRFRAIYPEIVDAAGGSPGALNDAIAGMILEPYLEGDGPETLEMLAESFLADYRAARARFPEAASTAEWTVERRIDVIYHDDRIVSLRLDAVDYTGGAHPNSTTRLSTLRSSNGFRVELSDVLVEGYEEGLNRIGEGIFRDVRRIPPDWTLEEAGFDFEDGAFRLNDNFAVTGYGLLFRFDPYEVAAYAMGPTELHIPREALGGLIRPDGVMAADP